MGEPGELLGVEESIPRDLLDKAECVAIVPSAKKFALGFGGRWGKGAVVCRGQGGSGPWGAPLLISLGGGSFGLQLGGQAADYVFLVMNPRGIDYLMRSSLCATPRTEADLGCPEPGVVWSPRPTCASPWRAPRASIR